MLRLVGMRRKIICASFVGLLSGCVEPADPSGETEGEGTEGSSGAEGESGSDTAASGTSTSGGVDPSGSGSVTTTEGEGSEGGSSSEDTGDVDPPPVEPVPLDWYPCPVFTGGEGSGAECAELDVPLDWDDPAGPQIELFIKRIGGGNGSHQMWMLQGGPGGSGVGYESEAAGLAQNDGLDLYLLDHRGTGRSTRLGCSAEDPASPGGTAIVSEKYDACLQELVDTWGTETLAQFNTTNASHDLGFAIDSALAEVGEQQVHVFGASYGTYWAHRYLQVRPDQADAVSMLGVAAPGFDFAYWERDYDAVGKAYLDACSADPACSSLLGPDAADRALQILEAVDAGQCAAAGLDRQTLSTFFASRMAWHHSERVLIIALLHRLERCDPADVVALQNASPALQNPTAWLSDPVFMAPMLGSNIRYGEMYKAPWPSEQELTDIHDAAVITFGSAVGSLAYADVWPNYEDDEYVDAYAETDTPVLMLHGEYDPNAPLGQALELGEALNGPNQRFYTLPAGNHTWSSPTAQGYDCARSLWYDFINDPTAEPFDCTGDVLPLSFGNDVGLAQTYFGTNSLFEG